MPCAFGGFLKEAQQLGWACEGVELSEHAVTVAKANGLDVRAGGRPPAFDQRGVVPLGEEDHVLAPFHFAHQAGEVAAGSINIHADQLDYLAQARWHHFTFALGALAGLTPPGPGGRASSSRVSSERMSNWMCSHCAAHRR